MKAIFKLCISPSNEPMKCIWRSQLLCYLLWCCWLSGHGWTIYDYCRLATHDKALSLSLCQFTGFNNRICPLDIKLADKILLSPILCATLEHRNVDRSITDLQYAIPGMYVVISMACTKWIQTHKLAQHFCTWLHSNRHIPKLRNCHSNSFPPFWMGPVSIIPIALHWNSVMNKAQQGGYYRNIGCGSLSRL